MSQPPDPGLAFLDVDGEVAARMRTKRWAETAVGEPSTWPTSLRTVLQVVMASRFAMWLAWGPELTFFCNDAYRPTLGAKERWLGVPARDVWAEIWPDIGPRIAGVMETGRASWNEELELFMERRGFVEETYHTGSYSPLPDDGGATVGILCVVTETTARVVADRRLAFLGDLAARVADARNDGDVWRALDATVGDGHRDLPLVAAYRYDDPPHGARLAIATGCIPDPAARRFHWPIEDFDAAAGAVVLDDPTGFRSTAWREPCQQALLVPIG